MFYIFYETSYDQAYQNALIKSEELSKKIFFVNDKVTNFKKEELETIFYYFLLSSQEPSVLIVERPETISPLTLQTYLQTFENLPDNRTVIFVTDLLYLLPKTIVSRSILFSSTVKQGKIKKDFSQFIERLSSEIIENMNELLDTYGITELITQEITIEIMKTFPQKKNEISFLLKEYNTFIKKSHYDYWKAIYIIIKT